VSFVPPSFSAGCGGIDLFGGSFSFINMNQFVDLMRAVASNAAGYAFQLAINAMCPDCGNVMSDLQKEVQQLNQMFSNSCQLAQGLVNDAASVLPDKVQSDMKMSTISFSKGEPANRLRQPVGGRGPGRVQRHVGLSTRLPIASFKFEYPIDFIGNLVIGRAVTASGEGFR